MWRHSWRRLCSLLYPLYIHAYQQYLPASTHRTQFIYTYILVLSRYLYFSLMSLYLFSVKIGVYELRLREPEPIKEEQFQRVGTYSVFGFHCTFKVNNADICIYFIKMKPLFWFHYVLLAFNYLYRLRGLFDGYVFVNGIGFCLITR